MTGTTARPRQALVGNRLALAGAVLYLLEFVVILGVLSDADVPVGFGATADEVSTAYSGNEDAIAFSASFFAVVLLGRVLLIVGIRSGLAASGRGNPLMDFAVAAMAVGVVLEVASYALAAAAGQLATEGATGGAVALDRAATMVGGMIFGPSAVALLCAVWCMWRSGFFPVALSVLGAVGGVAVLAAQLAVTPSWHPVADGLSVGILLFWVWMLWAGILLWRRAPSSRPV